MADAIVDSKRDTSQADFARQFFNCNLWGDQNVFELSGEKNQLDFENASAFYCVRIKRGDARLIKELAK